MMRPTWKALLTCLMLMLVPLQSHASWLKGLSGLASKSGIASKGAAVKAGTLGAGLAAVEMAASHIARLPASPKLASLAAHATAEGHWSFVNKNGEVFTAANADEMARLRTTLTPDLEADGRLAFYLSEETAAKYAVYTPLLPEADLHVVSGHTSFPLIRQASDPTGAAGPSSLSVSVRKHVQASLSPDGNFSEALAVLQRPLNKANVRMVSFEAGGPKQLASVATYDRSNSTTLADRLDPRFFSEAFGRVRGQTVIVTGLIDGDLLHVLPTNIVDDALSIAKLRDAAAAADVNLIVLRQASTRQPGGRNWLWQKVKVEGFDDAVAQPQFADFLNVLGEARGTLQVTATEDRLGRTLVQAVPINTSSGALRTTFGPWAGEVADSLRGAITVDGLTAYVRDSRREEELQARIVPGIPSTLQFLAVFNFFTGLIAYDVAWRWWQKLWPPEDRRQYGSRIGYHAARLARLSFFLFLFLPIVGGLAFTQFMLRYLWNTITAPLRWLRGLRQRSADA